jgi:hypothetical protein
LDLFIETRDILIELPIFGIFSRIRRPTAGLKVISPGADPGAAGPEGRTGRIVGRANRGVIGAAGIAPGAQTEAEEGVEIADRPKGNWQKRGRRYHSANRNRVHCELSRGQKIVA